MIRRSLGGGSVHKPQARVCRALGRGLERADESEGSRQLTSPGTLRGTRLVARIRTSGQPPSRESARLAQASSTRSRCLSRRQLTRRETRGRPGRSPPPKHPATAPATRRGPLLFQRVAGWDCSGLSVYNHVVRAAKAARTVSASVSSTIAMYRGSL